MNNKAADLRNHLFAQLERLSDDEELKDLSVLDKEIKRASSICEVAKSIIDLEKAGTDFIRIASEATQVLNSNFFELSESLKDENSKKRLNERKDND